MGLLSGHSAYMCRLHLWHLLPLCDYNTALATIDMVSCVLLGNVNRLLTLGCVTENPFLVHQLVMSIACSGTVVYTLLPLASLSCIAYIHA